MQHASSVDKQRAAKLYRSYIFVCAKKGGFCFLGAFFSLKALRASIRGPAALSRTYSFQDHLGLVRGTKSKIGDGYDTGTSP